jgi:hypothetical protein
LTDVSGVLTASIKRVMNGGSLFKLNIGLDDVSYIFMANAEKLRHEDL